MKRFLHLNLFLFLLLSTAIVSAHTPLDTGDGNNTPETALNIDDPTKSWTLYEELDEVDYYKIHLHMGEELRVSLYVSIWGDEHFTPSVVVMGADIVGDYEPTFAHPEELGRVNVQGERPDHSEYEPFTPASYYYVASYSHIASEDGDYYIAVYSDEHGGNYGMALGYRETFTLVEWLKIPIDLVGIHLWEDQPLLLLFGPPVTAMVLCLYFVIIKNPVQGISMILGRLSGGLHISSGVMTLTQMIVYLVAAGFSGSALLTLFFAAVQLGLGLAGIRDSEKSWVTWIGLSIGGFLSWAGWIIGPVLALGAGIFQKINNETQ